MQTLERFVCVDDEDMTEGVGESQVSGELEPLCMDNTGTLHDVDRVEASDRTKEVDHRAR